MPSDDLHPVSADAFSKREAILLATAAGAVVVTLTVLLSHMTLDDAYITFRYARHLAEGYGLGAWNRTGEHVEGYSSPLWTLLLGAAAWLGVDVGVASKVFGVAAALTVIAVLFRRRDDRPAVLTGVFLALYFLGGPSSARHARLRAGRRDRARGVREPVSFTDWNRPRSSASPDP